MRLSVAMCTYNGALYIGEQLDSILTQSVPVDEIVVCDDGSTDDTINIIESYIEQYNDISWVLRKNPVNLGVTRNFEQALSLCTGDIIFLSDQDDIWKPYKTKLLVEFLNSNPDINLIFTDAELITADGEKMTDFTLFDHSGIHKLKDAWENGLQFEIENVVQRLLGATFAIRSNFVKSCVFSNEGFNHDGLLAFYSVVQRCNAMIDDCTIYYRLHDSNVVGLGGKDNWDFKRISQINQIAKIIEPYPLNSFFSNMQECSIFPRIRFYVQRYNNYKTIIGKLRLSFSINKYRMFYGKYWKKFFLSDILYGIFNSLRNKLIYNNK